MFVPRHGLNNEDDHIYAVHGVGCGSIENLVEHAFALDMNAGRVGKNSLCIANRMNTQNGMACSLRFVGCNAELLSKQSIQQRRLAHIRAPYYRHQTATRVA